MLCVSGYVPMVPTVWSVWGIGDMCVLCVGGSVGLCYRRDFIRHVGGAVTGAELGMWICATSCPSVSCGCVFGFYV